MPLRSAVGLLTVRLYHAQRRPETLNLVQKTAALLPRIFSVDDAPHFSPDLLTRDYNHAPARVAVYGLDEYSGAQELVTALLEDPLSSDELLNKQIRDRWKNRNQRSLLISRDASDPSAFNTSASYLDRYRMPFEIVEIRPTSGDNTGPVFDRTVSDLLFTADIAVIVCNPFSIDLSTLLSSPFLRDHPNTILILTSAPSPCLVDSLQKRILSVTYPPCSLEILFMDPSRAVAANAILASNLRSPSSVQRFQDEFAGSRIAALTSILNERFSLPPNTSLRNQTSLAQVRTVLSTMRHTLRRTRSEIHRISLSVSQFRDKLEEVKVMTPRVIFDGPIIPGSKHSANTDIVTHSLEHARRDVKTIVDHLAWWKILWKVDKISSTVNDAVRQAWCKGLEKQLIFETGRLAALQAEITQSIEKLLAVETHPPLNSSLLLNSLQQIASSPSYKITPETLLRPINSRRSQITDHLTTRLHLAGQRVAFGMTTSLATGACVSWAGWVGWLTGSTEGVVGLDAGWAVGTGTLLALGGMRWAAGKWERSKKRWWEDWNRVGEGLGRDLRAALDLAVEQKVLKGAVYGCEKLSEIIVERNRELEELQKELNELTRTLEGLEQKSR